VIVAGFFIFPVFPHLPASVFTDGSQEPTLAIAMAGSCVGVAVLVAFLKQTERNT